MKLVVLEPEFMAQEVRARLSSIGEVTFGPFDTDTMNAELKGCEALIVRLRHFIGQDVLDRAPELRFIVSATTGLDHIDLEAAAARNIRVLSLRDCPHMIRDVSATAEHTWGLLLALLRRTPAAAEHVVQGGWNRNLFWGRQLRGKRLGIIGFGRIGSMVAQYGAAFGMDVVACDRRPGAVEAPASSATLEDLVRTADVISVHVTADPANRHLIGRGLIRLMKSDSVLINTARGMIIDAQALAEAVAGGRLAGAAVDVLEREEHGDVAQDPLLRCARAGYNVLITPHIRGATQEAIAFTENAVVGLLAELVATEAATIHRSANRA